MCPWAPMAGVREQLCQEQVEVGIGEVVGAPSPHPVFGMGPSMCFPLDLIQASVSPPRPSP